MKTLTLPHVQGPIETLELQRPQVPVEAYIDWYCQDQQEQAWVDALLNEDDFYCKGIFSVDRWGILALPQTSPPTLNVLEQIINLYGLSKRKYTTTTAFDEKGNLIPNAVVLYIKEKAYY
ncbi:hypothetical protein J4410_01865 [Candidatus Woesearchaeota archaeon]|nr:hypothetical protein [Candidatus Woesearchaeota archaeon]